MSRALVVLDTEFQRKRAAEWVWAAKNGSRVEFKGPKRTLDQNSLMWALLTDVAVHMRKAAGLEYSTEEWKHIFLHGWGREVRFLPALDGKGVVPIPQSSSDLSKEEMTDFIEYILKEGGDRGVPFSQHEPEAASPLPASESEAGALETQDVPDVAPASPLTPVGETNWLRDLGRVLVASIGQESSVVVNSAAGMNRADLSQATRDAARQITKFACRACGDYQGTDRLDRDVAIQMIENRAGSERNAA